MAPHASGARLLMPGPGTAALASEVDVDTSVFAEEYSHEVMDTTRRMTLFGGFLLVLLGCLSGLMFLVLPASGDTITGGPTPAVGVAHSLGCIEGILLIAIAAVWHLLHLDVHNRQLAVVLCLGHAYANWFGTFIAAWKHASGNAYDPSFTCSTMNTQVLPNMIVSVMLNVSLLVIPLMWMMMLGVLAKDCAWCSQKLIWIGSWIQIVICIIVTLWFLTQPVVNPLINPLAVDEKWPMLSVNNVKNMPACPYAVMRTDDYAHTPPSPMP